MKKYLAQLIAKTFAFIKAEDITIDIAKDKAYHFSTNVAFQYAKEAGQKPLVLAQAIVDRLVLTPHQIAQILVAQPGFINISLTPAFLGSGLNEVMVSGQVGQGQRVVIDYSSPNIAKKMHIGHLRSTVIGAALGKIYQHFGYTVIGDSHIGDWGTQFGKLIIAYQKWLNQEAYRQDPIGELQRIYVRFHREETPQMLIDAKKVLVQIQKKDQHYYQLWQEFITHSLAEYNKIYRLLKINFDYQLGESFYNDMMPGIVTEMLAKKIAQKDQGAVLVYFDQKSKLPPCIIQKQDQGFLYSTSDLAAIKFRIEDPRFRADKIIYVVDSRQQNHFKQVFAIAHQAGYQASLVHAAFGIMSLPDAKISTRKGSVINLEKLLIKGQEKALRVVQEKNPTLHQEQQVEIAQKVSVGAIKYFDLCHQRSGNIVFTWDKALAFNGNSAPYIQYTYVRISSLFKKANFQPAFSQILVTSQEEQEIVKLLYHYQKILNLVLTKNEPHHLANFLFKLTSSFNSWYNKVQFLGKKENQNTRFYIIGLVQKVIKEGLELLGIEVLEQM